MFLTSVLRTVMTHSVRPFVFTNQYSNHLKYDQVTDLGLYVHIPFCRSICSFCPYCKELFDHGTAEKYFLALLKEIDLVCAGQEQRKATSLYFGGGSPALMVNYLGEIIQKLKKHFIILGGIVVELHPDDITEETLQCLKKAGVTMLSIGIQSFDETCLKTLGRNQTDYGDILKKLQLVRSFGFSVLDMDLIFAIPNQTVSSIAKDIQIAFDNGATQISTYPWIDFSFAKNQYRPMPERKKKRLLKAITLIGNQKNLERTSVWTFALKHSERYSSVTRDYFLGFGVSATSLLQESFKINTFSIRAYLERIHSQQLPTALTLHFTDRQRACYYLFWNCYSMKLTNGPFHRIFGRSILQMFPFVVTAGRCLGLLRKLETGYELTEKGAYYYHFVEQSYTRAYIDKMWSVCRMEAFPKQIKLY